MVNNKGFTLVELIATLVILAIVMGIGAYSITSVIENSRKKDYQILIENINNAVEEYYIECKYATNEMVACPSLSDGYYTTTLGNLVKYGFIKGNSASSDIITIVNPNDNINISSCQIRYKYTNGKIVVEAVNPTGSCPTSY